MNLFFLLLYKILPLYGNVLLGYLCARCLKVERSSVATILFYVIGPIVIFSATISVDVNPAVVFLPVFIFLFSTIVGFSGLYLFKDWWSDATGNILAFMVGTGNTGYFGITLALILFEPELVNLFIFAVLGSLFYEATTGFYITAKGSLSKKESMKKVLRLPALYAFLFGIVMNISGVRLPEMLTGYFGHFKVVFAIVGMMVVGMGLKGCLQRDGVDIMFLTTSFIAKFVFWPIAMMAVILFDRTFVGFLSADMYRILFIFGIVPIAGNSVTLALLFDVPPGKAALAVMLSTVVSVGYIPVMLALYEFI